MFKHSGIALSGLLLATGSSAALGARSQASSPNCTTNSFTIPSWFIKDFRAEAETKASFQVYNRASDATYDMQCQSRDSVWSCAESSNPSLQLSLEVKPTSAKVEVNESWSCNERNPAKP